MSRHGYKTHKNKTSTYNYYVVNLPNLWITEYIIAIHINLSDTYIRQKYYILMSITFMKHIRKCYIISNFTNSHVRSGDNLKPAISFLHNAVIFNKVNSILSFYTWMSTTIQHQFLSITISLTTLILIAFTNFLVIVTLLDLGIIKNCRPNILLCGITS